MSSKFSNWVAPTSRRPSGTYTTTCQATWTTVSIVLSLLTYLLMLMKRGWVAGCGHQDKQWCRELAQPAQSTGAQGQARLMSACNAAVPQGGFRVCHCPGVNAVSVRPTGNVTPGFRAAWTNTGRHTALVKWQRQHTRRIRQQCHTPTYVYSLLNYSIQFKAVISQTVIT